MRIERRLERLYEASRALQDEPAIVQLAAESLAAACPRGLGLAYTIRGHPARAVGAAAGRVAGADVAGLERFRRAYGSAQLYYDRSRVPPEQRERWLELPQDWFRGSAFYPIFRPFGRMARSVICLGARPMACVGLLLQEGAPPLDDRERARVRLVAERCAAPLRLVALLAHAEPALAGVEHLLSGGSEATCLLSAGGAILSSSPAAQRVLARQPDLADVLARAVRTARGRACSLVAAPDDLQVHVTPCAPRGAAPGYLAVLGAARAPGRDRLTLREAELIGWVERGLTNAGIARRMGLAAATVKTMLERLYRRAGVHGRVALLALLRHGSIAGDEAPRA